MIYAALLMVVAGGLFLLVGAVTPAYTDPVAAERIRSAQECEPGVANTREDRQCPNELWHRSMDKLRTGKWSFIDAGGGLLLSGLAIGVFVGWNREKPWQEWQTPKWRLSILGLAGFAWLVQIPAYALLFLTELSRGYLPHWADSIAIPITQVDNILKILFFPYVAVWTLFVVGARLPVAVFSGLPGRPLINAFWSGATALLLVPVALVLVGAMLEGPTLMVPFLWLTFWLALCARAAALSRHRAKPPQHDARCYRC